MEIATKGGDYRDLTVADVPSKMMAWNKTE